LTAGAASSGGGEEFVSCGFFVEQIELFDIWLQYNVVSTQTPPEQLPIILQVLLSQQHRMRALELLAKFVDLGAWAVRAALSVGISPYVLKLLSAQPTKELRFLLTFIWAKILAVDNKCGGGSSQRDLVMDKCHIYFLHVLADTEVESGVKCYAAFV